MPKRITSPVPEYPGDVVLCDPLTLPQVWAIEDAQEEADALYIVRDENNPDEKGRPQVDLLKSDIERYNAKMFSALCQCVEKWEISTLPEHPQITDFPATPKKNRIATRIFLSWLLSEVIDLYDDAAEIPNA